MSSASSYRRYLADSSRPSAFLSQEYGLVVDPNDGEYRYRRDGDRDVSIATALFGGPRAGTVRSRHDHLLVWIADGRASVRAAAEDVTTDLAPGMPVLLGAGITYQFRSDCQRVGVLHLSDRLLRRRLLTEGGRRAVPLRLASEPRSSAARNRLCGAVRGASAELRDEWVGVRRRRVLNGQLAEVVLDAFPPADTADVSPISAATRAQEWIRAHAQAPITVADIAEAVHISERHLQLMMQKEFNMTPTDLLRDIRLRGARQALLDARDGALVGDIARSWQLNHVGRFAVNYARTYGESPSVTLRTRLQAD